MSWGSSSWALSGTMLIPLIYGLATGGGGIRPLVYSVAITAVCGTLATLLTPKPDRELSQREGLLLVVSIWAAVRHIRLVALPVFPAFCIVYRWVLRVDFRIYDNGRHDPLRSRGSSRTDSALATFFPLARGMGIVVLGIAILPLVGHGGMQLYRAEFSGAKSERLKPRIAETAISLWKIYVALTAAEFLALRLAGMTRFEAICHAFSTLGTGGFSTRSDSIAGFNSPLIESIIIVFMLLAGISFIQHYRLWVERNPRSLFEDFEFRYYILIILTGVAVITASLIRSGGYAPGLAVRNALFQMSSIVTTTGFVTDDFEVWHPLPQLILLALMFVGGCTGSTAGGMKVSRIVLLARVVDREFKRMVERRGVFAVRLGGNVIAESTIQSLLNLVYLALVVNFVACLCLAALGVDVLTAISAVAASMFNIGPGLGGVGPTDNYGGLPDLAKWVLAMCMVAGRLEFYTVIVILTPAFWRK